MSDWLWFLLLLANLAGGYWIGHLNGQTVILRRWNAQLREEIAFKKRLLGIESASSNPEESPK